MKTLKNVSLPVNYEIKPSSVSSEIAFPNLKSIRRNTMVMVFILIEHREDTKLNCYNCYNQATSEVSFVQSPSNFKEPQS